MKILYRLVDGVWTYILMDSKGKILESSPHRYQVEQVKSYLENIKQENIPKELTKKNLNIVKEMIKYDNSNNKK